MLGFVLMTRKPTAVVAPPVARTLQEELASLGIRTIPLDRVRAFQQREVKKWKSQGKGFNATWEEVALHDIPFRHPTPPPGVSSDIAAASTIPNTRVYAERFDADPFVFIERKRAGADPELLCFGCWDTDGFVE